MKNISFTKKNQSHDGDKFVAIDHHEVPHERFLNTVHFCHTNDVENLPRKIM